MNLVRWEPLGELEEIVRRMGRAFGDRSIWRVEGEEALSAADWVPPVDIRETEKEYFFKMEVPDIRKEDIKVQVENGTLTIAGERRQEHEEKGTRFHRMERAYGKFVRNFALPSDTDGKQIDAQFRDGLLTVRVAKSEDAKPKKIEVKVA